MTRRALSRALAVCMLALLPAAVHVTPALASCAVPPPLASAVNQAAAVFVGTVTATDWGGRRATVDVEDVWRGQVPDRIVVVGTPGNERTMSSVDRRYDVGKRYLFLPGVGSGARWQDICSQTREYSDALAPLRPVASAPSSSVPVATTPEADRASGTALIGLAVAGTAVAAGLGAWLLRRRPPLSWAAHRVKR